MLTQMDELRPSWVPAFVEKSAIEDEPDTIQYGQVEEDSFYRLKFDYPVSSAYHKWPTAEQPDNLYKFASVWVEKSMDEYKIER